MVGLPLCLSEYVSSSAVFPVPGPAESAAIGAILIPPAMYAQGYSRGYSAALIAAAGSTAIIVPPSIKDILKAGLRSGLPFHFLGKPAYSRLLLVFELQFRILIDTLLESQAY